MRHCTGVVGSGGSRARPPLENAAGSGTRVDAEGRSGGVCRDEGRGIALDDMYGGVFVRWEAGGISVQVTAGDNSW